MGVFHRVFIYMMASAISLQLPTASVAAVVTFTDRTAWESAVANAGLTSQTESFDSVAPGTHFASPMFIASDLGFTVTNTSGNSTPLGNVVMDGIHLLNLDGTTYLSADDDGIFGQPDGNTIFTFPVPISAFGFDYGYYGGNSFGRSEGLAANGIDVFPQVPPHSGFDPRFRFAGFLDVEDRFTEISTTGRDASYQIDNVAFATSIPESSPFLPTCLTMWIAWASCRAKSTKAR